MTEIKKYHMLSKEQTTDIFKSIKLSSIEKLHRDMARANKNKPKNKKILRKRSKKHEEILIDHVKLIKNKAIDYYQSEIDRYFLKHAEIESYYTAFLAFLLFDTNAEEIKEDLIAFYYKEICDTFRKSEEMEKYYNELLKFLEEDIDAGYQ